jgi:hypothetical protein
MQRGLPGPEQTCRNLQIYWNFSALAAWEVTGRREQRYFYAQEPLPFPLHPTLLIAHVFERPLVSDLHCTRQSRKLLQRALRSPSDL